MSFFGRIFKPSAQIRTSRDLYDALVSSSRVSSGVSVTPDTAMQAAAVWSCVQVLSQSVAQLPLHLYRRDGKSTYKAIDHPIYRLIGQDPNSWMTSFSFWSMVMAHLALRGNFYAIKAQMPGGPVRELLPVHPSLVRDVKQDENFNIFYEIQRPAINGNGGVVDVVPGDRVFHLRGLCMDGLIGLSPVTYLRESIGLAIATEKHGARLFSNGARLGGILSHPGTLTEPVAKRIRESFNEVYAGVENAHKTAVLEEGMKWTAVTMSAEDSQFIEARKYQRSEIAGIFRVPSHMVNDLEKATFSNVEHLGLQFVMHTLTPWLVSIEKSIHRDLIPERDKKTHFAKFNAAALLRGDTKSRYEAYNSGIMSGWLAPNEAREMEDLNPRDGLDEIRAPLNTEPVTGGGAQNEPRQ